MKQLFRIRYLAILAVLALAAAWITQRPSARADDTPTDTQILKGKPAPDFSLATVNGKNVKLSDQKGTVVMLDFWATWCPPCRESLPNVQSAATDKMKAGKGLKVFAVNAGEDAATIKPFLAENKYTFITPMDANATVMGDYKVQGIPTTVIIGRDGSIRDVFTGFGPDTAKSINDALDAALK